MARKVGIQKRQSILKARIVWFVLFLLAFSITVAIAGDVYKPADLFRTRVVRSAEISPDGKWIAYTVSVPRSASDEPGGAYSELYVLSIRTGESRPFVTGKQNVSAVSWRPDGRAIGFLTRRGEKAKTQVWMIPLDGGEARQVTHAETNVTSYHWHPTENKVAYLALTPKTAREKALSEAGYGFIYYEENLKHRNLYLQTVGSDEAAEQLTEGVTVWTFEFAPDGGTIAASVTPRNLIDERYAFRHVHLLDLKTKKLTQLTENPGKLGNFVFSPDGTKLAYAAALTQHDNAVSQAFVMPVSGGTATNLTIPDFRGHVNWVGWQDENTVIYRANEGVNVTLSAVKLTGNGTSRKVLLNSRDDGIIFGTPSFTKGLKEAAFVGQSPEIPGDVFFWKRGKDLQRLTTVNPWLNEKDLGKQEAVQYKARDGMQIEGLLIYPVGYQRGRTYPLVVLVHGGPESNYSNGWITRYSTPGQILSGEGYVVLYPNYRSSTGYGVKYAAYGYNDAAGVEFDDIADAIEFLIREGYADPDRIGLGGGSYGGYASAWFATYYTKYVKAVCMFVGISDLISKRGTTDIPYEELFVHSGKKLEEMWQKSLERSPIYYAHQSKTATLIYGGAADTRVHPSQSLELYRRMKMNNHPAVRLVQYPGEHHGNRRQTGQIDVIYRIMDWYNWYVRDAKPLDGPMPPLDVSDRYGISLPQ